MLQLEGAAAAATAAAAAAAAAAVAAAATKCTSLLVYKNLATLSCIIRVRRCQTQTKTRLLQNT